MSGMESTDGSKASAFDGYVEALIEVIGHADRAEPLRDYCTGLMMPVARKSVEPLAAMTAPARVSAKHQSLLHFVGQAPWSDEALMGRVRDWVLPRMVERGGSITAWIVDDTGFPKKGKHSVGVARQYCGQLGKQDNCQVAVSLSIANESASLPVAWQSSGWMIQTVAKKQRYQTRSFSRPSHRLRWIRSARRSRHRRRWASSLPMPVTVQMASSAED
jgi:SRSO17 transposase